MPPKRGKNASAAPAKPALDGCKIVVSGTFPGATHASIKAKAEALGATFAAAVTDDSTHLVATETDYNKPTSRVAKAKTLGIHIVNLEWLSLCEQNNARESENDHLLGSSPKSAAAQPDAAKPSPAQGDGTVVTTGRTRKRASPQVADGASDNETAPQAKRAKGRKAPAAKAGDGGDAGLQEAKTDGAAPKEGAKDKGKKAGRAMGEGQVAKNKDLQIPLDEGCPFVTSTVYIDDSGVIWDASLNQTNASANNNKFYRVQVGCTPRSAMGAVC
jgi:poly [ADP-ribose] polymerase